MKVYFDEFGYPAHIIFDDSEKRVLDSDNFFSIKEFFEKAKKLCDYWDSLSEQYKLCKMGGFSDEEYKKLVREKQLLFFGDMIEPDYVFLFM